MTRPQFLLPRDPMRNKKNGVYPPKTNWRVRAMNDKLTRGWYCSFTRTWNIESGMTLHAMPSCQGVFHSCRQGMSEVQGSRHVGWGNDHDKFFVPWFSHCHLWVALVESTCLPPVLPCSFHCLWVVRICHGSSHVFLFSFWSGVDKLWSNRHQLDFFLFIGASVAPLRLLLLFLILLKLDHGRNAGE